MRYNPISGRFELPAGSASVDGTAINPSSIGATTPGPVTATEFLFDSNTKIFPRAAGRHTFTSVALGYTFEVWDNHLLIRSDTSIEWSSSTVGQASDLILQRDASNTLAQRNGTSAQESRLYATYTSSTVYERLSSKYDSGSGAFVIGTEKGASGGSARDLIIQRDGTSIVTVGSDGIKVKAAGHLANNGGTLSIGFGDLGAGYPAIRFGGALFLFSDHMICIGGTSSSYPALKRNGTGIDFRLADDSADAPITVSTVKTVPVLYSALPAAATIGDGARAFITDGASAYPANIGGTASGGGANPTPVMTLGGAWIYG